MTLRNVSSHACRQEYPYSPFTSHVEVTDARGTKVWTDPICYAGLQAQPKPLDLNPGQSYVVSTRQWDQGVETERGTSCQGGPPVPPGQYTARATLHAGNGDAVASDASTFAIVA